MNRTGGLLLLLFGALTFIWAGMVLGVSFLAAPVKFQAPELGRVAAMDVGRHVFGVFNKVEILFLALSIPLAVFSRPKKWIWALLMLVWAVVLTQSFWLFPQLAANSEAIINGNRPPAGDSVHQYYVIAESAKVLALFAAGWGLVSGESAGEHGEPEAGPEPDTETT